MKSSYIYTMQLMNRLPVFKNNKQKKKFLKNQLKSFSQQYLEQHFAERPNSLSIIFCNAISFRTIYCLINSFCTRCLFIKKRLWLDRVNRPNTCIYRTESSSTDLPLLVDFLVRSFLNRRLLIIPEWYILDECQSMRQWSARYSDDWTYSLSMLPSKNQLQLDWMTMRAESKKGRRRKNI